MSQECPVKTNREVPLALGCIRKSQAGIPHYCFPMLAALWMKLKFHRNNNYVLDGIIEAAQCIGESFIPFFAIGQSQLWNSLDKKPLNMQHFVSNRPIGEVSIGRCKELNASGFDVYCEFALTCSSAFILVGVENHLDVNTRTFLHFKDELLEWLTKSGKILGLHMPTMLDSSQIDTTLRLP